LDLFTSEKTLDITLVGIAVETTVAVFEAFLPADAGIATTHSLV